MLIGGHRRNKFNPLFLKIDIKLRKTHKHSIYQHNSKMKTSEFATILQRMKELYVTTFKDKYRG